MEDGIKELIAELDLEAKIRLISGSQCVPDRR